MSDKQEIKVGDIVYQKRRGWSGVPMEVLELETVIAPFGLVPQALCKGVRGWGVNGLYSWFYKTEVARFAVANLTHTPNSAMGGVKEQA